MNPIKAIIVRIRRLRFDPAHLIWLLVALLLYWALRNVQFSAVLSALSQLSFSDLLILLAVNILVYLAIVSRWWLLLFQQKIRLSPLLLLRYWLTGFAFSYLLPGPQLGGGILQVYFLQHNHDISPGLAASSVTTSKLLERLGNFIFLGAGLYAITRFRLLPQMHTGPILWAMTGTAILPIAYLGAVWLGRRPLTGLFERLPARWRQGSRVRRAGQFARIMESAIGKLCRETPLVLLAGVALTCLSWLLILALTWLALTFLQIPASPLGVLVIVASAQLAFLVPLPMGLGSVEAAMVAVFQALGLDASQAISLVLLVRLRDLTVTGLGLLLGGRTAWHWWRSDGTGQTHSDAM